MATGRLDSSVDTDTSAASSYDGDIAGGSRHNDNGRAAARGAHRDARRKKQVRVPNQLRAKPLPSFLPSNARMASPAWAPPSHVL